MTPNSTIRNRAKAFVKRWANRGSEKSYADNFWEDLLENVFDVKRPYAFIEKQKPATVDVFVTGKGEATRKKFIDIYIPKSGCVIEHKSSNVSLDKEAKQSDGRVLNARKQAQRYYDSLDRPQQGRYLIACNFKEFVIFDNDHKRNQEIRFSLNDLPRYLRVLHEALLCDINPSKEKQAEQEYKNARSAYEFVKKLHDLLKEQYPKKERTKDLDHLLNVFCVRVVFCLYADDSGLFKENALRIFLERYSNPSLLQEKFGQLFEALNTPKAKRHHYDDAINVFEHVNGGLFGDEKLTVPQMSTEIRQLLLNSISTLYEPDSDEMPFHWSDISPTNFGCIFENTVSEQIRKNQGMHYTTIENIHRVIDPLFLNNLNEELDNCLMLPKENTVEQAIRDKALDDFVSKIGHLGFLDPACGSGNFLTETFRSLRRLEHKALCAKTNREATICAVRISQFHGIEIDDFACQVAKTAMWIAWCQMEQEAKQLNIMEGRPFPLESNTTIVKADALKADWNKVLGKSHINYIIGNPPFMGSQGMKQAGLKDSFEYAINSVTNDDGQKLWKKCGDMDYVCAWFAKSAAYMHEHSRVRTAFVSTNSITQGEQVACLWKPLVDNFNLQIPFAWKSFSWYNEATDSANVHCVIIAMSCQKTKLKDSRTIYEIGKEPLDCDAINSYLLPYKQLFLKAPTKHIQNAFVPQMRFGSMPNDTVEIDDPAVPGKKKKYPMLRLSADERNSLIAKYPELDEYIPRIFGSDDYISNEENYCIWLYGDVPSEIIHHKAFSGRFAKLREKRLKSTRETTRALADTPYLFGEIRQPQNEYLLVPGTSSENRQYVPIGYVGKDVICSNAAMTIDNCPKWFFSILTSSIHMAWMKVVCGRMKSDYRYSVSVVYNNFPVPANITEEQKMEMENAAEHILYERRKHKGETLEELYRKPMQKDLLDAHRSNDKVVLGIYSQWGITKDMTDEEIALVLLKKSVELSKAMDKQKKKRRTNKKVNKV